MLLSDDERAEFAMRLACQIEGQRLRVHAAGCRTGAAVVRADLAATDRERLAWEAQAHLAAEDAQRHGAEFRRLLTRLQRLDLPDPLEDTR